MSRSVAKYQLNAEQQKLVEENLNLARREAWRYQRRTEIDYKILESVAFEGLCQAAYKYDSSMLNERTGKPMRFSSIAVPYARGAILHYMRDKTYLLKLSHKMRENWLKGRRLIYQGKTDLEVAEALGIDLQEWLETRITCSGPPLELKEAGAFSYENQVEELDLGVGYLVAAELYLLELGANEVNSLNNLFNGTSNGRLSKQTSQLITTFYSKVVY